MRATQHCVPLSYRLLAGGIISPLLFFTNPWEPVRLSGIFWMGGWAAVAIAVLAPVVVRGDWVQRMLALVLLVLPVLSLIGAFLIAARIYF
jgi:hypothetical protein